jgi:hypothetical protein
MKLSAFWYAVGGFLSVPVCIFICAAWSVLILMLWPAVPFIFYFKRRKELKEETNEDNE